jgi:hypothetical protein
VRRLKWISVRWFAGMLFLASDNSQGAEIHPIGFFSLRQRRTVLRWRFKLGVFVAGCGGPQRCHVARCGFIRRVCLLRWGGPKHPGDLGLGPSVERPEAGSFEVNLLRRFGRVSDRSRNCPSTGEPRSRCRSRNRFIAKLLRHVRSAQHGQYGLGNARQCVGGYSGNSRRPLFRLL